jgi:hypothetical protein
MTADEINEIKRSTKLTTRHINSLLALIRKKYPQIGGLFNVHHATSTGTYPVPTEKLWMQIIHTGKCHWVLAVSGSNQLSINQLSNSIKMSIQFSRSFIDFKFILM